MSDNWSEGYLTEIDYTWGFHQELSPTNLVWVSALRGHTPPALDAPFTYCELGCGNALSLNVFAAAHPKASFYGVDFNPSHIANGGRVAEQGGIQNITFMERSFGDLQGEKDLPQFDMIALHGIWSWVSGENRQHIKNFLRERLKPGGLVYVSYNALPGWSEMVTVQRLMSDVANRTQGDTEMKVKAAIEWLRKYWETLNKEALSRSFRTRIERIFNSDTAYLAHEYFNKHWTLFFFQDVVQELRAAKLTWLTTATLSQVEPSFYLSRAKLTLVRELQDPLDQEQMRDLLSNGSFRRDVFLKGTPDADFVRDPSLNPALLSLLIGPRRSEHVFQPEVKVTAGTLQFKEEHERQLFEMVKDGPKMIQEIFDSLWAMGRNNTMALTSLRRMIASDQLRVWAHRPDPAVHPSTDGRYRFTLPFNENVINDIMHNRAKKQLLAAPNIGSGITVNTRESYILYGITTVGVRGAVEYAVQHLERTNRRIIVDGRPLSSRKAHEEELERELDRFQRHKLANYLRLGVLAPA